VRETTHFVNEGYGWTCKRCVAKDAQDAPPAYTSLPRFFREGEAEEHETKLSNTSLARWKDDSHHTLVCPLCGVEEHLS